MRTWSFLLVLVAALMAVPSTAFGDAQNTDFGVVFQAAYVGIGSQFSEYAYFFNPAVADFTVDGGLGILDVDQFKLLSIIMADAGHEHHGVIHEAFKKNADEFKSRLGLLVPAFVVTNQPRHDGNGNYSIDALLGAYVTIGEWTIVDGLMSALAASGYITGWGIVPGENEGLKTNFDFKGAPYLTTCGDIDGDGVSNYHEYWAAGDWTGALDPNISDAAVPWNSWSCFDELGTTAKFHWSPVTERIYVISQMPMTWADYSTGAFSVQWPDGDAFAAHPIKIHDAVEDAIVEGFLEMLGDRAWIGYTDVGNDEGATNHNPDDWYAIIDGPEGAPPAYTNWRAGHQPNGANDDAAVGRIRSDDGYVWESRGHMSGDPPTPRTQWAIYSSIETYPDSSGSGAPDAFEDSIGDLNPDGFADAKPTANFTALGDTSGDMPFTVTFRDQSDGNGFVITSWEWNMGDGTTYVFNDDRDVEHTYYATDKSSSTFTVSLTVAAGAVSHTRTRSNYITVNYVCPFKNELVAQGSDFHDLVMDAESVAPLTKLNLTAMGVSDFYDWELNGDGVPDIAKLAMIEYVACGPWVNNSADTFAALEDNAALFQSDVALLDIGHAWLADYAFFFGAMIGICSDTKDEMDAIFADITGEAGLPSYADYVIIGGAGAPLYAGSTDFDGDGLSNVAEYDLVRAVYSAGTEIDAYVIAATDPRNFWPGNPELPVAGIVGLGLLAGSILMGAAFTLRKK